MWLSVDPGTERKVLARFMVEPVSKQSLTTFDVRAFLALQKIWWEHPADLKNQTDFPLVYLRSSDDSPWDKFQWTEERVFEALAALPRHIIEPGPEKLNVVQDPTDNRILECALAAHVLYLITGDKGLLELKRYRWIHIVTPRAFLARLSKTQ